MQILVAKCAGFCEGVERAYRIALEQSKPGTPVYVLGNLVHNAQVVEKLKNSGIKVVKKLVEIPAESNGTLLISAHGVSPQIIEEAKALALKVVDTTCSWVKKAQKLAHELAHHGYFVVIIGDEGHPEVKGLKGWAGPNSMVISSIEKAADFKPHGKLGIISQTTQSEQNFEDIVKILKNKAKDIKIHKTICGATSKRQNAAIETAKKVELMLVIGDQRSANTKRLTELCKKTGTETYQIQTATELNAKWLTNKEKIGVTAGASTPDWVIKEVIDKINHEN
ncbi:MAG: 4-hydroxy-3-methylbut-2-enyl diphosphate reductase [Candidatus Margulisbacteria bacterium]|nr:4-hydroxy-3-methylbut-2-enyl diphosphate reductase [Candidatus Margulisiibacteriota bacterium]MBU1021780.1 4-hydroxy-3-methylbut-2-enyl diphosphate reductase [Candidatus Margulisiibacteriota bacterium]MBU1729526.1 4-hydroxy-3-methylbut-2-enyl diphosphate reductase [Candidatus Margulisiibacteriota bacterium]MBU1955373.1 4-hydroxy-3-methylbut-2-enyl diphosphate reductase [Candidatus Margulisiibacteriota bacterium]